MNDEKEQTEAIHPNTEMIAKVCHEANRAFCEANLDFSQVEWNHAPDWQRNSAMQGVLYRLSNPDAKHSDQHDAWMQDKIAAGWTYGVKKDADNKTHPCIVPYDELPEFQKRKDALFQAIVDALK